MFGFWKVKLGSKANCSEEETLIPWKVDNEIKSTKKLRPKKVRKFPRHSPEIEVKQLFSDDKPTTDVQRVAEIQKLIQDGKCAEAHHWIVKLEDKYESLNMSEVNNAETTLNQQMMMDVDNLSKELKSKMWSIMKMPIRNYKDNAAFLSSVYAIAKLEDERDVIRCKEKQEAGNMQSGRPSAWVQQFTELVQQSVQKQIPLFLEINPGSCLKEHLRNLQQTVLTDLLECLSFLNQNEILKIFAKIYHACIFHYLDQIFQENLEVEDFFIVFFWITHIYKSKEFMGHPGIRDITLKASVLDPCLEASWVCSASEKLINIVQSEINVRLMRRLKMEDVPWSQLPADIKQILQNFIDMAQQISETLGQRIQRLCAGQLIGFLQSYPEHIEKSKKLSCRNSLEIVTSCVYFRDYVTEITHNNIEDSRKSLAVLKEVETKECDQLLDKLFHDVKSHLTYNQKNDEHSTLKCMEQVKGLVTCYFTQSAIMKSAAFKPLVERAHYKIVQEYITVLIGSSVRCTSNNRSQLADKIIKDSYQLEQIFADQQSSATWLNNAIQHLAEMIKINDIDALKTEVAVLVKSYPYVRKEHIRAILDIKGNISKSDRQSIFNQMDDMMELNNNLLSCNRLFQEINVSKSWFRKIDSCILCCIG
ncbi:exocyst complex component 3-like protein 2 [Heptranchias perlo]|uniref:exocyst complex component 3-like protein 2 n=1 Tax=Heptranchias perlo TaxID=212740 RepID=UPI00355A16B3